MKKKNLYNYLGEWLFPPRCPICDEVVPVKEKGICGKCLKKVKYVEQPRCCKCGKHILKQQDEYCTDCSVRTHYYESGRALYEYKAVVDAVYRFKYGGRREYAEVFGEEIAFYLGEFLREIKPDALVPVPMYIAKERARGYNQATLLAREVGRQLEIPVYEKILKRIKNTRPLKLLNPEERVNNLKRAFILAENSVKLNTIVIIDDIYTTGSTINEMARVLREEFSCKVYFVTLCIGETI